MARPSAGGATSPPDAAGLRRVVHSRCSAVAVLDPGVGAGTTAEPPRGFDGHGRPVSRPGPVRLARVRPQARRRRGDHRTDRHISAPAERIRGRAASRATWQRGDRGVRKAKDPSRSSTARISAAVGAPASESSRKGCTGSSWSPTSPPTIRPGPSFGVGSSGAVVRATNGRPRDGRSCPARARAPDHGEQVSIRRFLFRRCGESPTGARHGREARRRPDELVSPADRFDRRGSTASREYDAQLGAFAANVAAIVDALPSRSGASASLLSRPRTRQPGPPSRGAGRNPARDRIPRAPVHA